MTVAARPRAGDVALALPWLLLAVAHAGVLGTERAAVGALLVLEDCLVAALFVLRHRAERVSWLPWDAVVAFAALALPLALSAPEGVGPAGALEIAGVGLALLATATLGRHLGILPALRGVTTGGVYAVVRHPMYAAHLLIGLAYVLGAPGWRNGAVVAGVALLLLLRLRAEEAVLGEDARYRTYCERVPWRLVPGWY